MGDTLEKSDVLSAEWLEQDVPCKECGKAAQLRALTHRCAEAPGPSFRCISCWQKWAERVVSILARFDHVQCRACKENFPTILDFADYQEF